MKSRRNVLQPYSLSVIIPIHRHDLEIGRCIRSLLKNHFLELQVIVAVNSESSSEIEKIIGLIPDFDCIEIYAIHKCGKSNAINAVLKYIKNEYVLIGDADTIFVSEGLDVCLELIHRDRTIVALTGAIEPIENGVLSLVQQFEYRRIFRIFKPIWSYFNANILVPGCAGIFKKAALIEVGLYDCSTLGEDFEITLRLHDYYIRHNIPYKVAYVDKLIARTEVPTTIISLIRQRGRWFVGQVNVLRRYCRIILHPVTYRRIIIPYVFMILFEVWETYLKWLLVYVGIVISICEGFFFLNVFLISYFVFLIFEIMFNLFLKSEIEIKNVCTVIVLTTLLLALQFLLKDTNIYQSYKLRAVKENRWN